eukprot:scaffold3571_cov176-Amphora_coffeaeformis.AAC.11
MENRLLGLRNRSSRPPGCPILTVDLTFFLKRVTPNSSTALKIVSVEYVAPGLLYIVTPSPKAVAT